MIMKKKTTFEKVEYAPAPIPELDELIPSLRETGVKIYFSLGDADNSLAEFYLCKLGKARGYFGRTMDTAKDRRTGKKRTSNGCFLYVPEWLVEKLEMFTRARKHESYKSGLFKVNALEACAYVLYKDPSFPLQPIASEFSKRQKRVKKAEAQPTINGLFPKEIEKAALAECHGLLVEDL